MALREPQIANSRKEARHFVIVRVVRRTPKFGTRQLFLGAENGLSIRGQVTGL